MAQKFLTDIELTRGLKDSSGDLGTSGQVLSSTGTGLNWINSDTSASVVYQDGFTGNGNTTAFTLANSIDNENKTQVYIDGVYQHKDTYSLSNTTLTFSTAPPNLSDIEVISFSSVSSADDILYDTDFASAGLMKTDGSGTYSIVTDNSSNWNTAYTYSQVGHLPLAGGTLTGGLTGTAATFSASITASGNSNSFGNTTVGALTASSISSSGSLSITGNTNSIGATTFTSTTTFNDDITLNVAKVLKSSNNPVSNFLDFDDDSTTHNPDTNVTTLASVSGLALATNLNDGGGGNFTISTGSTGTRLLTITTAGNASLPSGSLTVNSGNANVVATFESTDGTAAIKLQDPVGNVELSNAGSMFNVQPSGGTATFIVESNGRIRATDGTRTLYMGAWDGANNRIEGSSGHNILMTSYNADIIFGVNGTGKMIVDSDGNVVIGTSYDGAPGLTISDGLNLSFGTGNNNESYVNFFRQASSAAAIMATGYRRSSTANKMESSIGVSWAKSAVAANYGQILFYTDPASADSVGTVLTPTERMKIDSAGKVTVGICSGTLKEFNVKNSGTNGGLRIEHNSSANTVAFLGQGGTGDEGVLFLQDSGVDTVKIAGEYGVDSYINSGQFGIGTSNPNAKLHVDGSVHFGPDSGVVNPSNSQLLIEAGSGNSTSLLMYTYGASIFQIQSQGTQGTIGWGSSQARTVVFTNTGAGSIAVGINETAPAAKLQVSGDRDGNSEYVAILGEDGGANGTANNNTSVPVHKTLLTGYSIPYSGQSNSRLTSVGFLEFDSTPGWTGNQRNWALTSGYDMGGTNGPKFAILMGDAQNVEPQLGTNGATGTGTGDGANTRVAAYWKNSGDMVLPEGGLFVKGRITGDTDNANNTVNYLRTITIPYTGNSGSFTFDIDPVAEFGTRVSGGRMHLSVSGWQSRMNAGYIVYRNNGTGTGKIGTGNVTYYRYIWSETGGSQAMVSVSLISSSTNVIRISFSGWHTNDHGFEARLTGTS